MNLFEKTTVRGAASVPEMPPDPELAYDSTLSDRLALVRFRYTLSVPTVAGPICAENKRLKFGSISPSVCLQP